MEFVRETELPGIGRKFSFKLLNGGILTIIVHSDGKKNVYYRESEDSEPIMFSLTDDECRYIGSILGGAYPVKPTMHKVKVTRSSMYVNKTVEDFQMKTGLTVLVLTRGDKTIPTPELSTELQVGDVLVVVETERKFEV
jgi:TrkA domain protein